jgi:phosphoribosylanthranilate isomerase
MRAAAVFRRRDVEEKRIKAQEARDPAARELSPQVKICGLTSVDQALECVELGAGAIGCVFYPRSPRHLTDAQAQAICRALPPHVWSVGVFVDESFDGVMRRVERCGLRAVQLHGREEPDFVGRLLGEGVAVFKALFVNARPSLAEAPSYAASAFLAECAGGALPGGNALSWDWSQAMELASRGPLILAGGLNPENVATAIRAASPDALDVSSGVEAKPGTKDMDKVRRFLDAVLGAECPRVPRKIFA